MPCDGSHNDKQNHIENDHGIHAQRQEQQRDQAVPIFFFKQKTAYEMGPARRNSFTLHQMTRTAPIRTTRLGTATITYSARSAMKTLAMRVQRRIQGAISSFVLRDDITRNATTTPASLTVAETVMRLTPNPRIVALGHAYPPVTVEPNPSQINTSHRRRKPSKRFSPS